MALLVLVLIYNSRSISHILCSFSSRLVLQIHAVLILCPSPCRLPSKLVVGHLYSTQNCPYTFSWLRVGSHCESMPHAHSVTWMVLHRQGSLACLGHMMMVPCSRTVSLSSLWGSTMVPFRKTSSCKKARKRISSAPMFSCRRGAAMPHGLQRLAPDGRAFACIHCTRMYCIPLQRSYVVACCCWSILQIRMAYGWPTHKRALDLCECNSGVAEVLRTVSHRKGSNISAP